MREFTEYEKFMASYTTNVCDRKDCDIIQGLCDDCYRFLKLAGNELEAFIEKHNKECETLF